MYDQDKDIDLELKNKIFLKTIKVLYLKNDINTVKTKIFEKYFTNKFSKIFIQNENLEPQVFMHKKEYIDYTDYVMYIGCELELKETQIMELKYTPNVFKNLLINFLSYFFNKGVRVVNRTTWLISDLPQIVESDLELGLSRFLKTTRKIELNPFLENYVVKNTKNDTASTSF